MRGLTIVVAGADRGRFRTALTLAATHAALGGRTRLFLDGPAVALLRDHDAGDDARQAAAGAPTLSELIDTCAALSAELLVCQTGLAEVGAALDAIGMPFVAGGLTGLLAELGDDRLLAI